MCTRIYDTLDTRATCIKYDGSFTWLSSRAMGNDIARMVSYTAFVRVFCVSLRTFFCTWYVNRSSSTRRYVLIFYRNILSFLWIRQVQVRCRPGVWVSCRLAPSILVRSRTIKARVHEQWYTPRLQQIIASR